MTFTTITSANVSKTSPVLQFYFGLMTAHRGFCAVFSSWMTNLLLQNPGASVLDIQLAIAILDTKEIANALAHYAETVLGERYQ